MDPIITIIAENWDSENKEFKHFIYKRNQGQNGVNQGQIGVNQGQNWINQGQNWVYQGRNLTFES